MDKHKVLKYSAEIWTAQGLLSWPGIVIAKLRLLYLYIAGSWLFWGDGRQRAGWSRGFWTVCQRLSGSVCTFLNVLSLFCGEQAFLFVWSLCFLSCFSKMLVLDTQSFKYLVVPFCIRFVANVVFFSWKITLSCGQCHEKAEPAPQQFLRLTYIL